MSAAARSTTRTGTTNGDSVHAPSRLELLSLAHLFSVDRDEALRTAARFDATYQVPKPRGDLPAFSLIGDTP